MNQHKAGSRQSNPLADSSGTYGEWEGTAGQVVSTNWLPYKTRVN
jgi:hypothetical protein